MIKTKYFIDQTTKGGTTNRLCLETFLKSEAQDWCLDLNRAFPHARHESVEAKVMCNHIKQIIEEHVETN